MERNQFTINILSLGNIFLFILCAAIVLFALGWEVILYQLPCPLCFWQRLGFLSIALGALCNLRFGLRASHYSMMLISALITSLVALRQIALHILPGTDSYNSTMLGFHLYTWSYIASMVILIVVTCMLSVDKQYVSSSGVRIKLTNVLFCILIFMIIINIISVLGVCGFGACPTNPMHYVLGF